MNVRGVIFDLDGTIIRFSPKIAEAKKLFLQKLKELGIDSPLITRERPIEIILRYLERTGKAGRKQLMKIANDCFLPYEKSAVEEAELRPGAGRVLRKLKELDYRVGLVSNNSKVGVELALKRFNLRVFFDDIVTREDVQWLKPHEEPLLTAMKNLDVKPWETVYVGDSVLDVVAGKRAGALVVMISSDARESLRVPARVSPDYLIKGLEELIDVVKSLEMEDSTR